MPGFLLFLLAVLVGLLVYDLTQRKHTILRNFPILGHFRYWLEAIGPELRQYIVTGNDQERPFSRDQRRWIYATCKGQNNYFAFGTDNHLEDEEEYPIFRHAAFPKPAPEPAGDALGRRWPLPAEVVIGGHRNRRRAFRPESLVNVSAMSFGSLSAPAVRALNRGCAMAGALHNTGEGGISPYHLEGGELIWQLGTGYFGARNPDGSFSMERLVERCAELPQVRAIEIKLSQGAKPGHGGILPGAKVSPEIAAIRGVEPGKDCISPNAHSAFHDVSSMLDFVESIADATGLPVGIKSAVGEEAFWRQLASQMAATDRGPDYVVVDGGEGGTGAGPLLYLDHVAFPFLEAFPKVYRIFAEFGLQESVVWIGSGRLGLPSRATLALALGCDMINVAREAMLALGCIQSMRCHTDHCPTGVATQNRWLVRGLDPADKSLRVARYLDGLRGELLHLAASCGLDDPRRFGPDRVDLLIAGQGAVTAADLAGYEPGWGVRPTASSR